MIGRRFTVSTKAQLIMLIDYLGSKGYAGATQAIMRKLALSPEELAGWKSKIAQRAGNGASC